MDRYNAPTTRLLTLLNISATKAGKRKRSENDFVPAVKLNKRKSIKFGNVESEVAAVIEIPHEVDMEVDEAVAVEEISGEVEVEAQGEKILLERDGSFNNAARQGHPIHTKAISASNRWHFQIHRELR
jgi:hypothetical protein